MIFLFNLVILLVFGGVYTFCVNGCSTESFWRITCWDQLFLRSFLQNPEDFWGIVFHLAGTWKVCAHYYFLVNIHHIFTRLHPEMLGSGAPTYPYPKRPEKFQWTQMKVVAVQVYVHEFSWFLGWWFLNIPLNHARCHFCGNERTPQGKKITTIYPLTSIDCKWNAWRIIPVSTCKWLITMVSKPPFSRVVPLPNFLSEMILQVHPTRYRHRPKTMEEQARGWGESPNWDMLVKSSSA